MLRLQLAKTTVHRQVCGGGSSDNNRTTVAPVIVAEFGVVKSFPKVCIYKTVYRPKYTHVQVNTMWQVTSRRKRQFVLY